MLHLYTWWNCVKTLPLSQGQCYILIYNSYIYSDDNKLILKTQNIYSVRILILRPKKYYKNMKLILMLFIILNHLPCPWNLAWPYVWQWRGKTVHGGSMLQVCNWSASALASQSHEGLWPSGLHPVSLSKKMC